MLVGSPAIDKGTSAGLTGILTTDQRGSGFPRIDNDFSVPDAIGGDGTDIGAFETILQITSIIRLGNGAIRLQGIGRPNAMHTIQSSPDLVMFGFLGNTTADSTGVLVYDDSTAVGLPRQFYRLQFPATVLSATINDSVTGTGNNQWEYGAGWHTASVAGAFQGDEHYAFTTGVIAHFRFNGSQVKIYTVKEPAGGNIGYALDGGAEQIISNYSSTLVGNSLSYTSPMVATGNHDLVVRVVGTHEPNATSNTITVDKAEVYAP